MNPASGEDRRCVDAALDGDAQAFERLVRAHQGMVRALMRRLTGEAALADDLAQGAFLIGWQKLAAWQGGSFRAWICTIAYRLYAQQQRRHGAGEATGTDPPDAAHLPQVASGIDLEQALDALPATQRHAVLLSCVAEMSHAEIASASGWPLGTVKSHVARGKARLRELLEAYAHDPSGS